MFIGGAVRRTNNARTPISDPVSPNVPYHLELDRRHSDSANMTRLTLQEPGSRKAATNGERHTYQNTEIAKQGKSNLTYIPRPRFWWLLEAYIYRCLLNFLTHISCAERHP